MRLNSEQITELQRGKGFPIVVEGPGIDGRYAIVDLNEYEAMQKQQLHESIAKGFDDIRAGRGKPIEEAFEDVRQRLGFPHKQ